MKTELVQNLYDDFNIKVETIFKYLNILKTKTKNTTNEIVEFIKLYEQMFDTLQNAKKAVTIPTDTQFSLEQSNTETASVNSGNLKEINDCF